MNRIEELFEKVEAINKAMESLKNVDHLYSCYPDDLSSAQAIWNIMSEDEKKNFTDGLITTDAASEGIAEAWTEWIAEKENTLTKEAMQDIINGVESYIIELVSNLGSESFEVNGRDVDECDFTIENGNEISLENLTVEIDLSDSIDLNPDEDSIRDIIESAL